MKFICGMKSSLIEDSVQTVIGMLHSGGQGSNPAQHDAVQTVQKQCKL